LAPLDWQIQGILESRVSMKKQLTSTVFLVALAAMLLPLTVFAKGNFSFIEIKGGGLNGALRSTDPALTTDFFAFTDFTQPVAAAPADPGIGYEIVRYLPYDNQTLPFDYLHYYPETGYVYYDGIVNGRSDYDGKWYVANSKAKIPFEKALPDRTPSIWLLITAATLSLLVVLGFFYNRTSAH
jgi:hypothetical protein